MAKPAAVLDQRTHFVDYALTFAFRFHPAAGSGGKERRVDDHAVEQLAAALEMRRCVEEILWPHLVAFLREAIQGSRIFCQRQKFAVASPVSRAAPPARAATPRLPV